MIKNIFRKYHILLLIIIWLSCIIFWHIFHGPKLTFDSYQYLNHAENILKGEGIGWRYFWYSGYIALLSVLRLLPGDLFQWVILFQVLLSGVAAIYIYKSTLKLGASSLTAFFSTLLFIIWPSIQVWNYFILTESVFVSLLIFLFYAILSKRTTWVAMLSLIILFQRPTGIIVILSVLITALIFNKIFSRRIKILLTAIVTIVGIFVANNILNNYSLVEEYSQGKIVYSADKIKNENLRKALIVEPNSPIKEIQATDFPLRDSFQFFINNPGFSIRLFGIRILYFAFDYRPYYSAIHNIVNACLLIACYVLSGFYYLKEKGNEPVKLWLLLFFMGCIAMAGLACITWEGRFFAPLYPFLFVFAIMGLVLLMKQQINK